MGKVIVVRSLVTLVILALIYSVFWFFNAGQIEKKVNNFVNDNASYISVGEIVVSGFPLSQKVSIQDLKFIIPNSSLNKYQTTVKKLEANADIFSSDFTISLTGKVLVKDIETNQLCNLEFNKDPKIRLSLANGTVSNFTYVDSGYQILNEDQIVTYLSGYSKVSFESSKDENNKITDKVTLSIRDIEGFDILNIYSNTVEKKIIDGIKTGEISITDKSSIPNSDDATQDNEDLALDDSLLTNSDQTTDTPNAENTTNPEVDVNNAALALTQSTSDEALGEKLVDSSETTIINPEAPTTNIASDASTDLSQDQTQTTEEITTTQVADVLPVEMAPVKSNLDMDIEYELVPNYANQQDRTPMDPTQIHDIPTHYSKLTKINNFEFSNSLYKVSINGKMNSFQDDSMPSGAITVTVEKIDNLISYVSQGLNKIADKIADNTPAPLAPETKAQPSKILASEVVPSEESAAETPTAAVAPTQDTLTTGDPQTPALDATQEELTPVEVVEEVPVDPYQNFLQRLTTSLPLLTEEVAQKNQLTEEGSAVFDIRRERNIEILINETSMREVLGKL